MLDYDRAKRIDEIGFDKISAESLSIISEENFSCLI